MFVRRKPNKSGTFSVQVVGKVRGRYTLIRSFGASKSEAELSGMERLAADFISTYGGQSVIDFDSQERLDSSKYAEQVFDSIADIRQDGVRLILEPIYHGVGFDAIEDETLKYLAMARVCQPKSKVATVDYLKRHFDEDVSLNKIYRYMDTLYNTRRELIQRISVEHTRKLLGGRIGIVFYDVTTLYFETAREDVLRSPGFSKDGKTAESQIVLGLLVSRDGYPLSYNVFNGSQYEGRTMIPIIDDFVQRFSLTDFIVVADAGLLSRKNIALLKQGGYRFILGGRIKKESKSVQDWVLSLGKGPDKLHETVINGDERIIVTNTDLPAAEVIDQYHGLWVVERAFRITKGTLEARPIFHFTERRIEAHICICFVAYKLYKELERMLRLLGIGLSVDKVLDIAKTISTVTVDLPNGSKISKTLLTRDEQKAIQAILPSSL